MAVGADQRVGIGDLLAGLVRIRPDGLGEVFEVHLMADARAGGHDAEVVEGALPPFEEGIALHIALILAVHVHLEGAGVAKLIDHDGVVDDQIHRVERVYLLGVAAKADDRVAHGGKVHHGGYAGEVLQQHAGGAVGNLSRVAPALVGPIGEGPDVVQRDCLAVLKPQHVFQHHLQRGGQAGEIPKPCGLRGGDRIIGDGLIADCEGLTGVCAVLSDGDGHDVLPSRMKLSRGNILCEHCGGTIKGGARRAG